MKARIKLGDFYLQGENGWGARQDSPSFAEKEATKLLAKIRSRGINARLEFEYPSRRRR